MGNGLLTRFWQDIWCGEVSLKDRFPRLFTLSANRDGCVNNFWQDGGWNLQWHSILRGGAQMSHLQELMEVLEDRRCSGMADSWRWELDASRLFSMKSLRQHIDGAVLPATH